MSIKTPVKGYVLQKKSTWLFVGSYQWKSTKL